MDLPSSFIYQSGVIDDASPSFSIPYTCIERVLCQHCLDNLLIGSVWFSIGCFPTAIVWWCMGCCLGLGHLSHGALFSLMMWLCELCQAFIVDVWRYNGTVKKKRFGYHFGVRYWIVIDSHLWKKCIQSILSTAFKSGDFCLYFICYYFYNILHLTKISMLMWQWMVWRGFFLFVHHNQGHSVILLLEPCDILLHS